MVYKEKRKKTKIISSKYASAAEMIGEVKKNDEIFGLTYGQFSFIDIIEHCINFTGSADIIISTWTAAGASTKKISQFLKFGQIKSCRFIIDRSFKTRQPDLCKLIIDLFGNESIITTRTHAKFCIIKNSEWNIVIRTSMNLNQNPRIECFTITDNKKLCSFLLNCVNVSFEKKYRK